MRGRQVGRVEDYTAISLIFAFINLFWMLCVVWIVWGFAAVLGIGGALHIALNRWQDRLTS